MPRADAQRRRVSRAGEGGTGVPAAEDFAQYQLQFIDAIQHDYEVIRPIVLFAETIAERSRQTGIERTVVGEKARRFVMEGMLGLVDQRAGHAGRKGHVYPEAVAAYMLYVKQLYPRFTPAKLCGSLPANLATKRITTP
jgi:hypothetical protein